MHLPQQDHYEVAIRRAQEFLRTKDPLERSLKSGTFYRPETRQIEIPFLRRTALLQWPEMILTWQEGNPVELREQILILHYLQTAQGTPLTGEWIGFAQIPGGEFYVGPFRQRSVSRFVQAFEKHPEKIVPAAEALGGWPARFGDVSVTFPVFPRVPITFVFWQGDEEIAPSGNVLFDSSIPAYLPIEDITVVCSILTSWLCRSLQTDKPA
jgi:hypothetical protein